MVEERRTLERTNALMNNISKLEGHVKFFYDFWPRPAGTAGGTECEQFVTVPVSESPAEELGWRRTCHVKALT